MWRCPPPRVTSDFPTMHNHVSNQILPYVFKTIASQDRWPEGGGRLVVK